MQVGICQVGSQENPRFATGVPQVQSSLKVAQCLAVSSGRLQGEALSVACHHAFPRGSRTQREGPSDTLEYSPVTGIVGPHGHLVELAEGAPTAKNRTTGSGLVPAYCVDHVPNRPFQHPRK